MDLTNRKAMAMIATGGQTTFLKKELRDEMKRKNKSIDGFNLANSLNSFRETYDPKSKLSDISDDSSFDGDYLSNSNSLYDNLNDREYKKDIIKETVTQLYDACIFPTIIVPNIQLKTIVKKKINAVANPSLSEHTRPPTNEYETFHREQYYDIHIYGSTRGIAEILICWPDFEHLSTYIYMNKEQNEEIHWFAPTTASTISQFQSIGKIIFTKERIKEYSVPRPPNKIIHSKYEDKTILSATADNTINDNEDNNNKDKDENEENDKFDQELNYKQDNNNNLLTPQKFQTKSFSLSNSMDEGDEFDINLQLNNNNNEKESLREKKDINLTIDTINTSMNNIMNPLSSRNNNATSSRKNKSNANKEEEGEEDESILNFRIQQDWLKWFLLIKHRIVIEARPAFTSLRESIMGKALINISHGIETNLSPASNARILKTAGLKSDEYNVIFTRPKVPTHIKGYRWSLAEDTIDTNINIKNRKLTSTSNNNNNNIQLSKKQVALYFRDTAGNLGTTNDSIAVQYK